MEKLLILGRVNSGTSPEAFRNSFAELAQTWQQEGTKKIRLAMVDNDVAAGEALRIVPQEPVHDFMASLWLDAGYRYQPFTEGLSELAEQLHAWVVTESEPLVNREAPGNGKRTPGMNQIVCFRKPESMSQDEWIDIWHNSHTQLAIDIQSTFGYRHNIICRNLTSGNPAFDAVVEENFPAEAMNSPHAFYETGGDEKLLQQRQTEMFESVQRFIDMGSLIVQPMSEYNF
jgi:hypothetical protein